ncbi:winged helix-turn-helix domain-containing tetratricopeptide repeat protein [Primorskyibacter sp. S187A]|uniref:winged helix-turn-helix domain-containing tetratricopeptide repeat protein n=1 Tax=Primorskyibacter sp. S187A TaxID=3415130 RepID=UPI003C7B8ED6
MNLVIDDSQRRAVLDGAELELGARAFDVLVHLHAHADRTVTKQELLDAVWAGLMVEEGNLTVQIGTLRKALGREAIKTVPGVGYRLTLGASAPALPVDAPSLPDKPSLAVLPFTNLTGQAEADYLVDGMVSEIISALGRIQSFFVISSTSSFTYKGRSVDLAQVGRELGVRYILEGSIQQAGLRLRIFAQLVEAETGQMIWQERFEGTTDDIFDLQDRVAESTAAALEPKLVWAEAARIRTKPTDSLAAYDLYLQGSRLNYLLPKVDNHKETMRFLREALELDPNFVQAKAGICAAHTWAFASRTWTFEQAEAAIPLARDVLGSGTEDPLALAQAGHYMAYIGRDHALGLTYLEQAAHLNPNSATIGLLLGWVHNYEGNPDAALRYLERAMRLSPLHPQIAVTICGIGQAELERGKTELAITHFERALSEAPDFLTIHLGLQGAYHVVGRAEESARIAAVFRERVPDMSVDVFQRTRPQIAGVYSACVIAGLRANGFPEE